MRQSGILAAACLYALDRHLERLAEDHAAAGRIADGLDHPQLSVSHPVETNIVILDVADPATAEALLAHLKEQDVLAVGFGPGRVRLVPNLGTSAADIEAVRIALNGFPEADA